MRRTNHSDQYIQTFIIIFVVAVIAYFVAHLVIPDKTGAVRHYAPAPSSEYGWKDMPDTKTVTASEIKTVAEQGADGSEEQSSSVVTQDPKITEAAPEPQTAAPIVQAMPEPVAQTSPIPSAPYKIQRAALCGAIVDKEPQNISNKFSKDARQVFFYTYLTGAKDTTAIVHRWYHKGKLKQTSNLPVRSPNWRTHSKRYLFRDEDPVGEWKVEAVEPRSGRVLETATFTVE